MGSMTRIGVVTVSLVAALGISPAATVDAGASAGVTVFAGPPLQKPPPGVSPRADGLSFYPRTVTVHVGEPVTWQILGFHTVTFAGGHHPYPFFVPVGKQPVERGADGKPFWWSGKLPVLGLSPMALLPQGPSEISSGSQVASSGLMRVFAATQNQPPAPYTLTFTQPGVYHYQCAVHPSMVGSVIVKPASEGTPAASSEAAAAQQRVQQTITDVRRLQVEKPKKPDIVWAGSGLRRSGAELTAFFPSRLVVAVGTSVRFVNHDQTDIHTVTFGKPRYTARIENTFVAPKGKGIFVNPLGAFPTEPPGAPNVYTGANHGNGFLGAGILQPWGSPRKAGPSSFVVTFTKRGTYHYECVIHQNMDGTIVVR